MITNTQQLRIEQIRRYVTIFEVLERMGLNYEVATQQIKCPFHDDHSPSARVFADQNKIWCWTEQRGWDVIDAVQTWQQLPSTSDACAWLEREFQVPGVTQSLQGQFRTLLLATPPVAFKESVLLVEQRLFERRYLLGFERYTKLLQALDLSVFEMKEHKLTAPQFGERMTRLLQAAS